MGEVRSVTCGMTWSLWGRGREAARWRGSAPRSASRCCCSIRRSSHGISRAAGGVNVRSVRLLPFDVAPVAERVIRGARFSVRQTGSFTLYTEEPLTYMTQRRRLDAYLAERAIEAGVTLREGSPVRQVERHRSHITVRTGGGEAFEGRTLVAADGVNGTTAKLAGIDVKQWMVVGLEGNACPTGSFPSEWEDVLGLDGEAVPGYYGWIFPKGDHLNIGVAGWQRYAPSLRARLNRLSRYYGFDAEALEGLRGHRLPMRKPDSPLVDGNVLLVGDAAGLLDPLTGEGIYAAIYSGGVAARHLGAYVDGKARDLQGYVRELEQELLPELRISSRLYDLLYFSPATTIRVLRHVPGVFPILCDIVRGDRTYANMPRRLGPLFTGIELAADAIRRTPRYRHLVDEHDPPRPERFLRPKAALRPVSGSRIAAGS